ncbi:MAG: YfiR family protein [Pseudomonadota bacterium]
MKFALHLTLTLILKLILTLILTCTLQGSAGFAWAASNDASDIEYQVKATYLYNFVHYVEWPPHTFAQMDSPVIIGVLGADEIGGALGNMTAARALSGRALEVRLLTPGDALAESLRGVQILFIGRRENGRLKKLLESIQLPALLIVTETSGALGMGSMINFVPVDEHIRFEVSVLQAERSGLKISARLLAVAQKIETRRP